MPIPKKYYTRSQFAKLLNSTKGYVDKLVTTGKLMVGDNAKIDITDPINFEYLQKRDIAVAQTKNNTPQAIYINKKEIRSNSKEFKDKQSFEQNPDAPEGFVSKEDLEKQVLASRIKEFAKKDELLQLKLNKELGTVIEKDIVEKYVFGTFDILFRSVLEAPHNVIDELMDIINSSSDDLKRSNAVSFLTKNLREQLDDSLNRAKSNFDKLENGDVNVYEE